MTKHRLDNTDRKILMDLQEEGRMTNVELAKRAGISAPPCLRRLRALEDEGYIKSYHANLNAEKLDFHVTAFVLVKLVSGNRESQQTFSKQVAEWPNVRQCHALTGTSDFLVKIVAKSWEDYQRFLNEELTESAIVDTVNSFISVGNIKDLPGVPLEMVGVSDDALMAA